MTRLLCAVCAVMILAIGCGRLTEQNHEYLFEMKSYLVESQPGCVADTVPCANFEVSSPKFTGLDTSVQASIDSRIAEVLSEILDEHPSKSTAELATAFVNDFKEFVAENPELGLGWYFNAKVKPLIATDTLISLQIDSEIFTGGAHGSYGTQFINVDPMTGTSYLLDALLKPGYEELLAGFAYEDFQRQRGYDQPDSAAVVDDEGGPPFQLNDNYGFRKEGIVFFYNIYEIGSYAEGPTEILIPYERLEGWIK
jgi:hypothetical protein